MNMSAPQDRATEQRFASPSKVHLRRMDWRFLLPQTESESYAHLVVLGGPEGLAQRAVEVGLAQRASTEPVPSADAVALLSGARPDFRQAAECLHLGGIFYCEVDRRLPGQRRMNPQRLTAMLRQAGLGGLRAYAVRPDFQHAEGYLPLDISAALRWYVTSLYPSANLKQWLFELALRLSTGLDGRRFARLVPTFAVTAVKGAPPGHQSDFSWQPWLAPAGASGPFYPALLTDAGNRAVILPFTAGSTQPAAVIKIPKAASFNGRTENEQRALAEVRGRLDRTLKDSVPEPLGLFSYGPARSGMESYLPGQSLLRSTGRWGRSGTARLQDLGQAADWLASFYLQLQSPPVIFDEENLSRWVLEPQDLYRSRFGATSEEEQLFEAARRTGRLLFGARLSLGWVHRDFNIWNLFRDGGLPNGRLHVIDWEGFRPGPPLCDLLHCAAHWHDAARRLVTRQQKLESLRLLYLSERPGPLAAGAQRILGEFIQQTGQDPSFMPLLLVYLWLELALRRAEQQRDMGQSPANLRSSDNLFLGYVETLARNREILFPNSAPAQAVVAHQPRGQRK
jgi:hypothetical protein